VAVAIAAAAAAAAAVAVAIAAAAAAAVVVVAAAAGKRFLLSDHWRARGNTGLLLLGSYCSGICRNAPRSA
jgi:hypothetical protein